VNAAVAVTTGEVVTAYGSTTAVAMAHRDAGIGTTVSHQKPATTYGDLPSRLDGDAVVYINLGTDVREHLHTPHSLMHLKRCELPSTHRALSAFHSE